MICMDQRRPIYLGRLTCATEPLSILAKLGKLAQAEVQCAAFEEVQVTAQGRIIHCQKAINHFIGFFKEQVDNFVKAIIPNLCAQFIYSRPVDHQRPHRPQHHRPTLMPSP